MSSGMLTREEFDAFAQRVREIEDRQEIADLVNRYGEFIRDREESRVAELMADDAWVELRHGDALLPGETELHERFEGKAQILGSFKQVAGQAAVVWPMVHNLRIVLDGDAASSRCIMASSLRPHGLQFIGEYRDTYRRIDGCWLFASRTFIGFGDMGGKSANQVHAEWQAIKVLSEKD